MTISLQLYTVRDLIAADRDGTLAAVAALGLDEVEPYGIERQEWLPDALAAHGLTAGSAHTMPIDGDWGPSLAAATKLGVGTLIQPSPGDWDLVASKEGLHLLAGRLNGAAERAADLGITVGYHNHDREFDATVDGVTAFEYLVRLLRDDVVIELDTYWAAFGGQDVPALLATLGDRVTHLHIKDGIIDGSRERRPNVALGEGDMDQPAVLTAGAGKVWVVEFDEATGDLMPQVIDSVTYLKERIS
jgi:sugar phosphate isomerase/epimerase